MSKCVRGSRSRQPKAQLAQVLHLVAALLFGYSLTATAAPVLRTYAVKSRSLQQNVASSGSFTVSNLRPVTPTPQQPDEELPERFNSGSTLAADTIKISFKVPGVGADDFQKSYQSRVATITGRLTGTPAASWQFRYGSNSAAAPSTQSTDSSQSPSSDTTSSSSPAVVSLVSSSSSGSSSSRNRRLLQEHQEVSISLLAGLPWPVSVGMANRKVLQQSSQQSGQQDDKQHDQQQSKNDYLEVGLSLLALAPHMVVFRLVRPTDVASNSSSSSDSCNTAYCSALLAAQVPVDTTSVAVVPDLGTLASRITSTSAKEAPVEANKPAGLQHRDMILAIAIGGGGGGLALLVLAAFTIRSCMRPKSTTPPVITKKSVDSDKEWQSASGNAVQLSRDFSYQPDQHQLAIRSSSEYPHPAYPSNLSRSSSEHQYAAYPASLSRMSAEATPRPVMDQQGSHKINHQISDHFKSDVDDRCSTVSEEQSEATLTRTVSTATTGESSAASSAAGAPGATTVSAAKAAKAKKSIVKLKFLKILSQDNLKSSSMSSSERTSSGKESVPTEDDEPGTPKASFFEDEDVADKVLKDLVPTAAKHQVVGGRVVFRLPHHRRVHSECSSPHFADPRAAANRSPFSAMNSASMGASTHGVHHGAPAIAAAARRGAASAATTPLTGSPKAASTTGETPFTGAGYPQQTGFRTPRQPRYGYMRHRPGSMSTGVISQVNTPPLKPDPSQSEVDPVSLYHALHGYYESLKEVRQLLAAHEPTGDSQVGKPMHSRAASSSSFYSLNEGEE